MPQLQINIFWLLFKSILVLANVEKIIFLGPSNVRIPNEHPTLEDLQLHSLSPQYTSIRTHLRTKFPTDSHERGESSWILLRGLSDSQRYELRICWAATEPNSFRLEPYQLPEVFDSVELINSLAVYTESRLSEVTYHEANTSSIIKNFKMAEYGSNHVQSVLLIHIQAAADYYTTNQTLMLHPPPVLVDIILDPYLLNFFPKSLVPTSGYLLLVATIGWYLAKITAKWLLLAARADEGEKND